MGLGYRVGQFWRLWTIKDLPADARAEVTAVLTPSQWQLYNHFSPGDQWHSYQVWRTLQQAGHSQPDLQVAALLHDVGKTQVQLTLWERTLIVLAEKLLPQKLAVWGQGDGAGVETTVCGQDPASRLGGRDGCGSGLHPPDCVTYSSPPGQNGEFRHQRRPTAAFAAMGR